MTMLIWARKRSAAFRAVTKLSSSLGTRLHGAALRGEILPSHFGQSKSSFASLQFPRLNHLLHHPVPPFLDPSHLWPFVLRVRLTRSHSIVRRLHYRVHSSYCDKFKRTTPQSNLPRHSDCQRNTTTAHGSVESEVTLLGKEPWKSRGRFAKVWERCRSRSPN